MARVLTSLSIPTSSVLAELASVMRGGGLLAIPTESSYALCVTPFDARAVERLCAIKGRPDGKPILVLVSRRQQVPYLVQEVPPAAALLMDRFWPGPLTIVCPAALSLPAALTGGTGTIGIRLPDHMVLTTVIDHVGPLTGTSANRSGEPALSTAREVDAALGDQLDLILNPGPAGGAAPSTLVDATGAPVRLLRPGLVTREQLEAVLQPAGYQLSG